MKRRDFCLFFAQAAKSLAPHTKHTIQQQYMERWRTEDKKKREREMEGAKEGTQKVRGGQDEDEKRENKKSRGTLLVCIPGPIQIPQLLLLLALCLFAFCLS